MFTDKNNIGEQGVTASGGINAEFDFTVSEERVWCDGHRVWPDRGWYRGGDYRGRQYARNHVEYEVPSR